MNAAARDRAANKLLSEHRPDYFPPAGGRYEVKPGLVRFGRPLQGGGEDADGHVFQFDASFAAYRAGKLAARRERLGKYFLTSGFCAETRSAVCRFILNRLTIEHPTLFKLNGDELTCALTGERLACVDPGTVFQSTPGANSVTPPYACAFDALASQVQEDLAVVSARRFPAPAAAGDAEALHWLSAIHLCFPNAWAAEDKVGRTFPVVHQPVAGMEQMNRQSDALVETMLSATEGLVRFAWGVTWDDELNRHPQPPPGTTRATQFDPARPRAFLRVERQTIWGFADVSAALFTIRTYLYDCAELRHNPARRAALATAIQTMSPESAAYKGLTESRDEFVKWLEG